MTRFKWAGVRPYHAPKGTRLMLACTLLAVVALAGCATERPPLVIGYLGGLTGRSADLGVAGRDGALLAVEEFNSSGGVDDRRARLAVADDRQDQDAARRAFESLVRQGALCVIGPMTSSISVAVAPLALQSETALISPTTSTDDLTGKRDHFFRLYPDNSGAATELARAVKNRLGHKSVAIVYDLGNESHTKTWADNFTREFEELGGQVQLLQPFVSGRIDGYTDAAAYAVDTEADSIFLLASSVDAAILATRLRERGWTGHIIASEWSASPTLIEHGGSAAEGIVFLNTFDSSSQEKEYREFRERFILRFGVEPGFASVHAYDSTRLALSLISEDSTPGAIVDALWKGVTFQGLQGDISLGESGDVQRAYHLMTVRDGTFTPLE